MSKNYWAIDLGTTNSAIALFLLIFHNIFAIWITIFWYYYKREYFLPDREIEYENFWFWTRSVTTKKMCSSF